MAAGAEHGLDEMTVIQLLGTLVDKSVITVSFPSPDARYDLLDTVRDYALERLAEGGGLAAARKAHAEYFATLADSARCASWTPVASVGRTPRARARQPLGRPHVRAGSARRRHRGPVGNARLVLHARGARFRRRRFVGLTLDRVEDAPAALRLGVLFCPYFATEELDLEAAIEIGERALAASEPRPPESALVEAALSLALAESE